MIDVLRDSLSNATRERFACKRTTPGGVLKDFGRPYLAVRKIDSGSHGPDAAACSSIR